MSCTIHPALGDRGGRGIALGHILGDLAIGIACAGGAIGKVAAIAAVMPHTVAGGAVAGMGLCGLGQAGIGSQGGKAFGLPFGIDRGEGLGGQSLGLGREGAGGGGRGQSKEEEEGERAEHGAPAGDRGLGQVRGE